MKAHHRGSIEGLYYICAHHFEFDKINHNFLDLDKLILVKQKNMHCIDECVR